jgi:hypothetical protein
LVTSQYENEPLRIIYPNAREGCRPQLDCTNKSEAECAIALYYDSDRFIKEGKKLIDKELYLSARVEFMQAMTRLVEAEIRVKRARLNNYNDYKIITQFGLDYKVKEKIDFCNEKINILGEITTGF